MNHCNRCGEKSPAEIHTCTPLDPLLDLLRVPENKREWVGLTEAERLDILDAELTTQNTEHFALAQAIEAKLKEKNNG